VPAKLADLTITEWAVLAVACEGPNHGFAISRLFEADSDLGRVFTASRPLVYRALRLLQDQGFVEPVRSEAGQRGPNRTLVRATRRGQTAARRWLAQPVPHVRDFRTQLLLKLRLLERIDEDPRALALAQRKGLGPVLDSLAGRLAAAEGFDRQLLVWRLETTRAAAAFLDQVAAG